MIHPIATISQRNNTHFKDLKNRIPTPFHKICKKLNYDPIIFKNTMDYFKLQYFSHDFDFHNNNNHKNIIISDEHSLEHYRNEHINHFDYNTSHFHNEQQHNHLQQNENNKNENNHLQQNEYNIDEYDLISTFPFRYNNLLFLKDSNDIIYHFHKHHQIGKFYSHNNIIIFN